jgi:hypothetical protein
VDPLVVAQIVVAAAQDMLFAVAVGALVCGAVSTGCWPSKLSPC